MPKRLLVTLVSAFVAVACGSPMENAVNTLKEQVRLGDPLAQSTFAENQELLTSPDAVPLWLAALATDESDNVKAWAAQILGNGKDPRALDALTTALDDSREVRDAAVSAIRQFDDEVAAQAFANGLQSESRDALAVCLAQLGRLQRPESIPAVAAAARSPHVLIAKEAVGTLSAIGGQRTVEPLRTIATDASLPIEIRRPAIINLGRIEDQSAVDALQAVADALQEQGDDELLDLSRETSRTLQPKLR